MPIPVVTIGTFDGKGEELLLSRMHLMSAKGIAGGTGAGKVSNVHC